MTIEAAQEVGTRGTEVGTQGCHTSANQDANAGALNS